MVDALARFSVRDNKLIRPTATERYVTATMPKAKFLIPEERHEICHQLFTKLFRLDNIEKEVKALKELSQRVRTENSEFKLDPEYLIVDHKDHLIGLFNWIDLRTEVFRIDKATAYEAQCSDEAILDFVKLFIEICKKESGVNIVLEAQGRLYFE